MIEAAYIHIPFCTEICHYCDFTKLIHQEKWELPYLNALAQEIKDNYNNEVLKTIYIGGGTPTALTEASFLKLLQIMDLFHKQTDYEYTIECNIESLTEEKIQYMKQYGVNRISIGAQTFHEKYLADMNRHHTNTQMKNKIQLLKQYGFTNINIDIIYALPNETLQEVEEDLVQLLQLHVPHISTYSLMIEPHTVFYIKKIPPIDEDLDAQMYETICHTLKKHGYNHYEFSNFAYPSYESKHNLNYWNNAYYYGFGLGASGYIPQIRYTNTKNFHAYCMGENKRLEEVIDIKTDMENELILGLRKQEGVNRIQFAQKYKKKIETIFPIQKLEKKGQLYRNETQIQIPEEKWYISNEILVQLLGIEDESDNQ